MRDDISRLTGLVNSIRSVKEQLAARAKALEARKGEPQVAALLKASEEVSKKVDALEDRMHNPKAEVTYDILAERGGTRLYSRLSPLQMWAVEGDGMPTRGMQQVLEEQEKELAQLEARHAGVAVERRRGHQRPRRSAETGIRDPVGEVESGSDLVSCTSDLLRGQSSDVLNEGHACKKQI